MNAPQGSHRSRTIESLKALASPSAVDVAAIEDIRLSARAIAHALEVIHGDKFKFSIGQDYSFVFVTRVR